MKTTTDHPDGVPVVEDVPPVVERIKHLMVSNNTRWEELETELQRIECGRCMLCNLRSENLICERCVPRGSE